MGEVMDEYDDISGATDISTALMEIDAAPDGTPWCKFTKGTIECINDPCLNPNHRSYQ